MPVHFASNRRAEKKGWVRPPRALVIGTLEADDGDACSSKAILRGKDRRINALSQIYVAKMSDLEQKCQRCIQAEYRRLTTFQIQAG